MGMRKTTIRLSDRLWALIQAAAEDEGITAAQYMREALIARVFYDQGARGERFGPSGPADLEDEGAGQHEGAAPKTSRRSLPSKKTTRS